ERFEEQSALGRFAAAPILVSAGNLRSEGVFVALHVLTRDPDFSVEAARRTVASVEVERRLVRIACRDGTAYRVQLVTPDAVDEDWGGMRLAGPVRFRSEEHTSELQSRENLVCRLLLEKKKQKQDVHQLRLTPHL